LGIPKRDGNDVEHDEGNRPTPYAPMPLDETILSNCSLQPRKPSDEDDHHQHEIGAGQASESTDSDEPSTRRRQGTAGLTNGDEGHNDSQANTRENCEEVRHPWNRSMAASMT
jgi:hypothetical protein